MSEFGWVISEWVGWANEFGHILPPVPKNSIQVLSHIDVRIVPSEASVQATRSTPTCP